MRVELQVKLPQPGNFAAPKLANMLAEPNAEQLVRGMRLHLQTKALLPNNVGNNLNCGSCHTNARSPAATSAR